MWDSEIHTMESVLLFKGHIQGRRKENRREWWHRRHGRDKSASTVYLCRATKKRTANTYNGLFD